MHAAADDGGKCGREIARDTTIGIQRHFAKHFMEHAAEREEVIRLSGFGFMQPGDFAFGILGHADAGDFEMPVTIDKQCSCV